MNKYNLGFSSVAQLCLTLRDPMDCSTPGFPFPHYFLKFPQTYNLILTLNTLEKEMVTHSSILAWKIPWTEKPGRLQAMGSQRVGHD